MRYLVSTSISLLLLLTFESVEPTQPTFVRAERCRLCHRSIYQTWAATAHRKATVRINPEDRSRDCLRCHATGPNELSGVQCEACHGPGGNYSRPEIMIDPEKAREAGLVEANEPLCRTCHGSGLPNHSSRFSMPEAAEWPAATH
jgi:hypothetical protein